jgi:hypothetical protein
VSQPLCFKADKEVRGCTDVVLSEVRLELAGEDLEGGRLSDTVRADETEDLTGSRRRQTMKLERVGGVTVGDLGLEVGRQVDDGDGLERASEPTAAAVEQARQGERGWKDQLTFESRYRNRCRDLPR